MMKTSTRSLPTEEASKPPGYDGSGLPAVSADEIVAELHKRAGDRCAVMNERQSERHAWVTGLTVLIEEKPGEPRAIEVTTHDISTGGLSFVFRQYIHAGTMLRLHFNVLPGRPALDGVVRNCVHVGGIYHRVGVQFVSKDKSDQ